MNLIEFNAFIEQGYSKLIESDSKYCYNVTKKVF